jgi:hypothetical protein
MRHAVVVGLLLGLAVEAQNVVTSTARERTSVSVTVYNDGRGLVREERALVLPAGPAEVRFMDVAARIEAPTVHVAALDGGALTVLEQNYEYDLLSPEKMLEKFVGETVVLVQQRLQASSTVEEEVPARLLSANQGTVWEIGGRIVTNPPVSRYLFPSVPRNLIAQPTLVWQVTAPAAGRRRIEAAYLTGGMSWRADYVLVLDNAEEKAALQGWVTVDNKAGATFDAARLKLVAGDVHRAPAEVPEAMAMRLPAAPKAMPQEEALFEYHLYTLPHTTSLKQNQTKQVQLLSAEGVRLVKEYVLRGGGFYFRSLWGGESREKVRAFLGFKNAAGGGLGVPLPKGVVRVYKKDRGGSAQFIGEDRIDHTPRDEDVRLELGNAFDVVAERKQTDFRQLAGAFESAYRIALRNRKETPVTVTVIEPVGGDWTMVQNSHPFEKSAAFEARFQVSVPAGQEAVLTYRVRVRS